MKRIKLTCRRIGVSSLCLGHVMGNKQQICGQNKTFDDCYLVLWETLINILYHFLTFVGLKTEKDEYDIHIMTGGNILCRREYIDTFTFFCTVTDVSKSSVCPSFSSLLEECLLLWPFFCS